MKKCVLLLLVMLLAQFAYAKHIHQEKEYQKIWCQKAGGITEFRNPDNTRVDCLTDNYAIEFDFAEKWAESIGQALYYGLLTNKNSGIVLISENGKKDLPYIKRAALLAKKYNIKLWVMDSFKI